MDIKEWSNKYRQVTTTPPGVGEIITGEEPIRVNIELVLGKPPFMYATLYVPNIVGAEVAWLPRTVSDTAVKGLKAILLPRARDMIMNHDLVPPDSIFVGIEALRVVKSSPTSLLVEVAKQGPWITENWRAYREQHANPES